MPSFVVEESLGSVKVFWLKQEELVEEIRNAARRLGKSDENVLKIVLFGSLADRKAVPGSDADILILLNEDERGFMERVAEWQQKFSLDFPTEVFPYTQEELDCPMAVQALKRGIVLFQRRKSKPKTLNLDC
jgi:predicted nucleotidyltransferase